MIRSKGSTGATGYVAIDNTNKQVILAMRGSVTIPNWIADILYFQKPCGDQIGIPGGKCEQGFWTFWDDSRKAGAMEAVDNALVECQGCQVIATGHSLGAAAAVFAAVELRKKYPNTILVSSAQTPTLMNLNLHCVSTAMANRELVMRC
jgi:hypothetical protein